MNSINMERLFINSKLTIYLSFFECDIILLINIAEKESNNEKNFCPDFSIVHAVYPAFGLLRKNQFRPPLITLYGKQSPRLTFTACRLFW